MLITFCQGSFLEGPEPLAVHGCNAQGVMGRGAALAVKNQFPFAFETYRKTFEEKGLMLGSVVWAYDFPRHKKIIGNAITQEFYRNEPNQLMVDYDAIRSCMKAVNRFVGEARLKWQMAGMHWGAVAMPKLGAGLGGGDWSKIRDIIESESTDFQPVVYIRD